MSGPAPSSEALSRRALRLSLGVTLSFVIAQLFGWPMAHIAPVLATLLLLDAEALPVRQALLVLGSTIVALVGGFLLALFLLPYPAVLVLAICLLLFRFFVFALTSGAPILAVIGVLLGCVVIPVVVKLLPELAVIVSLGMMANFVVAMLCAWVAFLVMPPTPAKPNPHHHGGMDPRQAIRLATTMTLVVAPLLLVFLMFGWTDILILVYATLIVMTLSSEASAKMGWEKVVANLVIGGVGLLVFYELLAAVPNVAFMVVLAFTAFLFIGSRIFSGAPSAGLWVSGFIGMLILIGAALLSDKAVPSESAIHRVVQIGIASAYVVFAYRVADLLQSLFQKPPARSAPKSEVRGT